MFIMCEFRRSALVSELGCLEKLFSAGREECQKLQARRRELHTAIQKARHIRQVPLLESYCHLDEVLITNRNRKYILYSPLNFTFEAQDCFPHQNLSSVVPTISMYLIYRVIESQRLATLTLINTCPVCSDIISGTPFLPTLGQTN